MNDSKGTQDGIEPRATATSMQPLYLYLLGIKREFTFTLTFK